MHLMSSLNVGTLRQGRLFINCGFRHKSFKSFMKNRYKKYSNDLALDNFDQFYKPVYRQVWPSIRLALLSQHKYCCFINNFGDITKSVDIMNEINAVDIRSSFNKRLNVLQERLESQIIDPKDRKNLEITFANELEMDEEARSVECSPFNDNSQGRFAPHNVDKSVYFNQYIPATKLMGLEDYVDESDYFRTVAKSLGKTKFLTIKSDPKSLPENWKIFCFNRGDINTFPGPELGVTGLLNYYLMDVSSILPAFALDPSPGDCILDMCAAPGGKTLAILQTLYNVDIVCVDNQLDRAKRLRSVLESYVSAKYLTKLPTIMLGDGRNYAKEKNQFDKILVDAPCTTDRRSATEQENNLFKPNRIKERTQIPTVQAELLSAALKAVKVGGSVVYSTCSLSPVQNDNVVQLSLNKVNEETNAKFATHDMSNLFFPFRFLMRFHPSTKFGHLVIPFVPCNFGPMYISKISKISE